MKYFLILFMLIANGAWAGDAYKWVDSSGRVQYSDKPVGDAQAIRLETPRQAKPVSDESATEEPEQPANEGGGYDNFQIVTPEPNQTFRTDAGEVAVSLLLEPGLQDGHRIRVTVDGIKLKDPAGTQITIRSLSRGSHQISATVEDAEGKALVSTPPVSFHLRRAGPEAPAP